MAGDLSSWAEQTAREQLEALPRRWKHVQGVVRQAEHVAGVVDDPDLLIAAAWLHDVGYAPDLRRSGCHAVDGARFLDEQGAPARLCALVAHHSCALTEADHRGIEIEWDDERTQLRDALWWADMTTTPDGEVTSVPSRIAEVRERYGPEHVVAQSVADAAPELMAAARRTEALLATMSQR
ncbi:HD domain-containing protein [Nocardia brasiliensis]|uniref:HD domain-containing protein n=1 Tax=Nocardia brasiliensis TaxID=37326 RepID=UPI0024542E53|nr:HD domain-containing protein [Nocardia brasiliensis]